MAEMINGKEVAQAVRAKVATQAEYLKTKGVTPGLAVILVGEDPASQIYVRNKSRAAQKSGVDAQTIILPVDTTEADLLAKIDELNHDAKIDAILVQSPVPAQINEQKVQEAIAPAKDVDGFHPENVGRLFAGRSGYYPIANTPRGIMTLLQAAKVDLAGKNAVVIGRSILVGKPMFALLTAANATVTLAHSHTDATTLKALLKNADIVVVGTGIPKMVKGADLKAGATVIDVGINRLDDGTIVGDVDFASAEPIVGKITPVPGGVGPMTIATLMQTTVELAAQHHDITLENGWQII
ncbi:MAG: bifunctional methylenetetrahydrofolate dehydrogenase/methenyltetrahydrofolate cyclohydrolase [Lactobacillaceae bacterium]|nr:bifunctional methylenetetrahydrofolate dehydrogenase/methenyltetrahydrofolate cyclohydrolase [Lactobacillaceae bacterium]